MIKTILVFSILVQPFLTIPPPIIADGRERYQPIEHAPMATLEPLQVDLKPMVSHTPVKGDWVAQCHVWAAQAGFELPEAAIKLLDRESKCSPTVRNPRSSAGGIPQALPWTKMGCPLSNEGAVCQLKWMRLYVMERYGSWESALAHSMRVGWY